MNKYLFLLLIASFAIVSCDKVDNLYRIQENGLYGFIDSQGNVVIEPQYRYVGPFSQDGYACVVSDAIIEKDTLSKDIFHIGDSCIQITYGYINRNNKLVIDTINHLYVPFSSLTYWGDELKIFAKNYSNNKLEFRRYFLNELLLNNGLFVFQDNNTKLFGYKDINNNIKIKAQYKVCYGFNNGLSVVELKLDTGRNITLGLNESGVIDTDGNLIVSDYSFIHNYNAKGVTWALSTSVNLEKGELQRDWVQLDKQGNIKNGPIPNIPWVYNNEQFPECVVEILGDTFYTFLNDNGDFLTDSNNDKMLSLKEGELLLDVIRFSEGVAGLKLFKQDGEPAWLFVDRNLRTISEPYDSIQPFSGGLAAVKEMTKFNEKSSHMGKWGYVKLDLPDTAIVQVIPFSYSECGNFSNGLAYFKNEGSTFDVEGYINKKGEVVWQTKKRKGNK